jgi:hypothetical protein
LPGFSIFLTVIPYSGGHISWRDLFLAGNQINHHNFVPALVSHKV